MPTLARRTFPASIRTDLLEAADDRERQLASLPPARDVVAIAHRRSVERILHDIRAAVDRLDAGRYGDCLRCGDQLPLAVLVDLPWETRCEPCAGL
jgi:RNA polymerase-binding transcription factor DksA